MDYFVGYQMNNDSFLDEILQNALKFLQNMVEFYYLFQSVKPLIFHFCRKQVLTY